MADTKTRMSHVVGLLAEDLRSLRAGRASAELVGDLPVASYGQVLPLKQLAGLGVNEQGQITVTVWDRALLGAVETAIGESQLGFSSTSDGTVIRLSLPPPTFDRRTELVKLVHQKGEAARVALRQVRSDSHTRFGSEKAKGDLREDDMIRQTKDLNQLIEEFNRQIKELVESKEKELMNER